MFNDLDESVEKIIRMVKFDEQADIVILLTHIGLAKEVALANNPVSRYVDYIFGNDTHERVREKTTDLGPFTFSTLPGTNYQFR